MEVCLDFLHLEQWQALHSEPTRHYVLKTLYTLLGDEAHEKGISRCEQVYKTVLQSIFTTDSFLVDADGKLY